MSTRVDGMYPCPDHPEIDPLLTDVAIAIADVATEQRVQRHIFNCPVCASQLDFRRQLLARTAPDRSEPPAAFTATFADSVMDRIAASNTYPDQTAYPGQTAYPDQTAYPGQTAYPDQTAGPNPPSARSPFLRLVSPRVAAWSTRAAAAVLLIAVGMYIGRAGLESVPMTDVPPGPPTTANQEANRESNPEGLAVSSAVTTQAIDVLDRSRTLLLDVMNADHAPNMDQRRRIAGDLAVQAAEIQTRLGPGGQTNLNPGEKARLSGLLQELEIVMLQLAHGSSDADPSALAMLRDGVDRNALLFKIELTAL